MTVNINLKGFGDFLIKFQAVPTQASVREACLQGTVEDVRSLLWSVPNSQLSDLVNQANAVRKEGEPLPLLCEISIEYFRARDNSPQQKMWKDIIELLLVHGASVGPILPGNATPFLAACRAGSQELAALFLKYGADPNHISDEGSVFHAIIHYVQANHLAQEMIQFAIDNKCDPELKNKEEMSPLTLTAKDPHKIELTKLLMKHANCDLLLHHASYFGNLPLMQYLIGEDRSRLEVTAQLGTPLDWAFNRMDNRAAVQYLSEDLVKKELPTWEESPYSPISFLNSVFLGAPGCHNIGGIFTVFAARAKPVSEENAFSEMDKSARQMFKLLLGGPSYTIGHEMGHAFACKALTGENSYVHIDVGAGACAGVTYHSEITSPWQESVISAAGPLCGVTAQIMMIAVARLLKNRLPRLVTDVVAIRAALWIFNELGYAFSSAIKKDDGDFGRIATTNTKHLAVASFLLFTQAVVAGYQLVQLLRK